MLLPKETIAQTFQEVTYTPTQTTFELFAPDNAPQATVRIYDEGTGGKAVLTARMQRTAHERWTLTLQGDLMGKFYTFDTGRGECPGVFAKAVGVNGQRAAIIDLDKTDPKGWAHDQRPATQSPADLVIYELHHRDFSIARKGARYPGKFLALTEPWAIRHLQTLGVNAIHILPSYDYGSVDEQRLDHPQYNWGYDPVNYNVPEGSYSTDPYRPEVRIREFKQMVQALHQAGIRVILDVVYNHTFDIDHSNFQRTYPDYFYRKVSAPLSAPEGATIHSKTDEAPSGAVGGAYSNGSGCGNETASEKPMMRQFMIESVKYWINEYHIDGFRFDLMGCHDIATMNAIRKEVTAIDPTILIYGEGWSAGACALPQEQLGVKANIPQMPGIAAFSDELRDALRGPFNDDRKAAFLAGLPGQQESVKFGIAGAIAHPQVDLSKVNYSQQPWATEPTQMISYVSCHDDMCLTDRLKASIPGITTDELIRLDLLAQTAVFTAQGIPFMLCGEEMLRSKKGVHNSYQSPDSINQLPWQNMKRYPQVFSYYQKLIALRKHHPAFRLGSAAQVRQQLEFLPTPNDAVVAFRLKNFAGGDDWRNIIVVLNANREAVDISVPDDRYTVVCRECVINEKGIAHIQGDKVRVAPQSALIMHDRYAPKTVFDRIEPAHWFVDMKNPQLQLMVYGQDIAAVKQVTTSYPGVVVDSVVRLDSPNYLLVYLNLQEAKAGTMTLLFDKLKVDYELKERQMSGDQRKGFDISDVLYLLMPDRFAQGEHHQAQVSGMRSYKEDRTAPSLRHGGDLEGLRQHLDYFTDLGVTALWFTPILENDSPDQGPWSTYHGYACTNYYRVDPRFGTNEDYRQLIDECHKRGLKVVMDMIFNHCGFEHPWVADMPSADWFNLPGWLKESKGTSDSRNTSFQQTSYKLTPILDPYASEIDKLETQKGWFVSTMPDLNQHNPHLMRYLIQNSIWWIETAGIDGIRMDTYPYAYREPMAQWMKALDEEYPHFNTVGETWVTQPAYTATWQQGSKLSDSDSYLKTVMDFSFQEKLDSAKHEETDGWWRGMNRLYNSFCYDYLYPDPSSVMAFIDNHDTDRFLGNGSDSLALRQALALLLTVRRIPQLYYGTEIMMNGTKEVTDGHVRKDFPGGFPGDQQNAFTAEGRTRAQQSMFRWLSRLLHWRQGNEVITQGKQIQFIPYNGIYVIARQHQGRTVLTILNGTSAEATMSVKRYAEVIGKASRVKDIPTGRYYDLSKDLHLSPRQSLVLEF